MNLETLATAVKSNFETLQESEIIGRIMIISGRDFDRSMKGFEILLSKNLIPETFIDPKTRGKFAETLEKRPWLKTLMQRMDLVPGKLTASEPPEITFIQPKSLSRDQVLEILNFSNLDF